MDRGCFICQLCVRLELYKTAEQLRHHMVTSHRPSVLVKCERVGNVKCPDCKSVFGYEKDLELHKVHLHRAYPCECQLCTEVFRCRNDLARHINEIHRGSPFNRLAAYCEPCAYIFDDEQDLRRHNLIISYDRGFRW